jgi:hypothetical protein
LYASIPQLPAFFASSQNWKNQLVLLTLGTDTVTFFLVAYALLVYYCMGGMEGRALTESNRRLRSVYYLGILFLELALATAHLFAARVADVRGLVFRCVMLLFGLFWATEATLKIRNMVRNIRRARKHKIPLPWFAGVAVDADRTAAVSSGVLLLLSVASLTAMFWYLHGLVRYGADWVRPLAASGYSMAFIGAAAVLVMRGLYVIGAIPYDSLENEILFESLSSAEIKERFTRYILGSSAAEWLAQQTQDLKDASKALGEATNSIAATLREIQASLPAKPAEELREDVVKMLTALGKAVLSHQQAIERHRFLIHEFAHALGGQRKTPALDLVMSEWKSQLTQMLGVAESSSELRNRLIEFSRSMSGAPIAK